MKTKPQLRARKMWANYYPTGIICHPLRRKARINAPANCLSAAIPVVVIPLDDVEGMMQRASCVVDNMICTATIGDIVHAVLVSSGVLPRQRKGGAK